MYILLVLLISLLLALVRGGQVTALAEYKFHRWWLIFVPLLLQLMVFSPLGSWIGAGDWIERAVYLSSMLIGALVLLSNQHIPGTRLMAAGLGCNFLVILLNGGAMPVWSAARQFAGLSPLIGRLNNVVPLTSETMLPWFADIIPLPAWLPMANVYSLGDMLIMCGAIVLTQRALFRPPQQEHRPFQN